MKPTMSQYASKRDYDRAMAQRDLNPHKPARMAMWLWGANYAASGLGSMGYWDSLSEGAKDTCRRAVADILAAQDEGRRTGYMGNVNGPGCDPDCP